MKRITANEDIIWAGTDLSYHAYLEAINQAEARINAGWSEDDEEDEDDKPYLLSVDDNGLATVRIAGAMSNVDRWYNKYFGIASYPAIREALVYAANDANVKMILLDINSGGGSVNGVSDTGDLIRLINNKVKPVYAYTDGAMCSAAYWLGCSAEKVFSSNVSTVGSIGVIATHMEYSKQLKEDGVGVTVMRSGRFKALMNSFEPLTEEAKAEYQSQLDAAYKVFASHVAVMRGRTYEDVDTNLGQGREFFGEAAFAAGLVDGIESFDSLMSRLRSQILDMSNTFADTSRNLTQGVNMNNKKALTQQEIAALASGAALQTGAAQATSEQVAPEPSATNNQPDETQAAAAAATAAAASQTADKLPKAEAAPATASSEVVSFLQAQVKEKDEALIAANVELAGLKAKLADFEASVSGLLQIAGTSISNMRVALGGAALDITGMTATAVLAEHQKVSTQFATTYPVGGVAAVEPAAAEVKADISKDPLRQARLASVRLTTAK